MGAEPSGPMGGIPGGLPYHLVLAELLGMLESGAGIFRYFSQGELAALFLNGIVRYLGGGGLVAPAELSAWPCSGGNGVPSCFLRLLLGLLSVSHGACFWPSAALALFIDARAASASAGNGSMIHGFNLEPKWSH